MQIQRVNRTDAEKVFINVQNKSGATLTVGWGARFCGGAAAEVVSTDGVQVVASADAAMCNFAGVVAQDLADNGYGRVQAWGYVNSIAISGVGTSITIGVTGLANAFLKCGAAAGTFFSGQVPQALSTMAWKYLQAFTTNTISTHPAYLSGFVRAL